MKNIYETVTSFPENYVFTEDDLKKCIDVEGVKQSTLRWELYHLCQKRVVTRIKPKTYIRGSLENYRYDFISEEAKRISECIREFDKIKIAVWDETILNEWLNLLLAQNIVFVEVEKDFSEFVFERLKIIFDGAVLYNPSLDVLYRYQKDNIIVVKNMISKSPINGKENKILLEKLIVDLLYDKFISKLLDSKQTVYVVENIVKRYVVDETKLLAYAKRKNKKEEMTNVINSWRK